MDPYFPDSTNEAILSLITSITTWCISSNASEGVDFYDNWIMLLLLKSTPSDAFDEIHQVVLDRISDNMASLVESGKYRAINKNDMKTE